MSGTNFNQPTGSRVSKITLVQTHANNKQHPKSYQWMTPHFMSFDQPNGLMGSNPVVDDIRTNFHPASGHPMEQKAFEDFGVEEAEDPVPYDSIPWHPLPMQFDFEVANLVLLCSINKEQTNKFLKLLEQSYQEAHTHLENYDQVQKMWDATADRKTRFKQSEVSVPYKNEIQMFDVYYHPLWDWIVETIKDLHLALQMDPEDMTHILNQVAAMAWKGDQKDLLKQYSLHYGQNAFLSFTNFNPYEAVSFDDLHFNDSGLWSAHLFLQLKKHLDKIGQHAEAEIDRQ
uniref:Uncharacterized protein n=1 Tax=Moniliophthora roreri TaxID=221103 RepID=A0A0W0FYT7_MONRR